MKIAVPTEHGRLATHFGRSPHVMFFTVNDGSCEIIEKKTLPTPPHEPGAFPNWLREHNVDVVIAGGMGQRALRLFTQAGIRVVVGAPSLASEELVGAYLTGELTGGMNACSHGPDHRCPN